MTSTFIYETQLENDTPILSLSLSSPTIFDADLLCNHHILSTLIDDG